MKIVLDSLIDYQTANPIPDSISGDTVMWSLSNITYDSLPVSPIINVITNLSAQIGDTITIKLFMYPSAGDVDSSNNDFVMRYPVINSYDPNDKQVYPQGTGSEGYISNNQKMYYTIRFQNTGNTDAINIYVLDSLDSDLHFESLRITGSSHLMATEILPGNVLKFNFDNIYLPDSTSNEQESHGYVMYEIDQISDLAPYTEIENTAYIYFDFNPAIVTNTVINTIYDITTELPEKDNSYEAYIYPNPANGSLTLETEQGKGIYQLQDITGKQLMQGNITAAKFNLDISALSKGIYFLSLFDGERQVNKKVVKE